MNGNEGTISKLFSELSEKKLLNNVPNRIVEFYYSGRKVQSEKVESLKKYLEDLKRWLIFTKKNRIIKILNEKNLYFML